MFRAILVALKPAEPQQFLIEFATILAARHQWEVIGLSVIDADRLAPAEAVPIGASAAKVHRDQECIANARKAAGEATRDLEAACRARSVRCTTYVHDGDIAKLVAHEAQAVDLLVCGHTAGGDAEEQSLLHSILKHNVRPAMVVPQIASTGESILLAYDGSAQAGRVLASFANSGLGEKRQVYVISLHQNLKQASSVADMAATFLRRHGIAAEPRGKQLSHDVARQILEEAMAVNAGFIALGTFGKSFVREFFFGSVTNEILKSLPLPVFIDH